MTSNKGNLGHGQLMCNLDRAYRASHNDMDYFYLEEDEFLAFLKEFANR